MNSSDMEAAWLATVPNDALDLVAAAIANRTFATQSDLETAEQWGDLSEPHRVTFRRAALDALNALLALGRVNEKSWCHAAARRHDVAKQEVLWALGAKARPLGDDEIFVACLDAIISRAASDTDGSPQGPDREGDADAT